jgi:hypothetical protein
MRLTLSLLLLLAMAGSASALDLVWSSHGTNLLTTTTAAQCTLLVRASAASEALPDTWTLVWSTHSDADVPIRVVNDAGSASAASVCGAHSMAAPASNLSRVDTLDMCATQAGPRALLARYILEVGPGTVGRIVLLYSPFATGVPDAQPVESFPTVTINGGGASSFPPVLETVWTSVQKSEAQFVLTGHYLDAISSANLACDDGHTYTLTIVDKTAHSVRLQGSVPTVGVGAYVQVADPNGMTAAIELPRTSALIRPHWALDHVLVRFRSGRAEPPSGKTAATPEQFTFTERDVAGALKSAGVTSLDRLLPWFHPRTLTEPTSKVSPSHS